MRWIRLRDRLISCKGIPISGITVGGLTCVVDRNLRPWDLKAIKAEVLKIPSPEVWATRLPVGSGLIPTI